jgi:hypothetical protein
MLTARLTATESLSSPPVHQTTKNQAGRQRSGFAVTVAASIARAMDSQKKRGSEDARRD